MSSQRPAKPGEGALPFWKTLALGDMSQAQWESLCDHCGRCCLHKIEDLDSGAVFYTSVVCRYLDTETCHCSCYPERSQRVPDCLVLTPGVLKRLSHDPLSVHKAGISVRGKAVPETCVHPDELVENIIHLAPADPEK